MRYAILAAVSTKKQAADDKTSLPNQVKDARAAAQAKGWVETAGPYQVPGHSRTRYINLRDAEAAIPALRKMLNEASRGQYDVLVMQDHDRFRSLLRAVYQSLCDYRVQLYSLAQTVEPVPPEQYDPYNNDAAEIYIGVSEIRSATELSRLRRKYRSGMRDRVRVHGLPPHAIPWGYVTPPLQKRTDRPAPVPDPDLVPHLVQLKERLLRGQSTRQLIDYLVDQGVPPPRGNTWHPETVLNILKNPFYAGMVRFEITKMRKDRRNNQETRSRSRPEEIITGQGKHQPLWTMDEHRAILAEYESRSTRRGSYRGRLNNQLTGLLHCGECGAPVWRYSNGSRSIPGRQVWRCTRVRAHVGLPHPVLLAAVGRELVASLRPYIEHRQLPHREPATPPPPGPSLDDLRAQLRRLEDAWRKGRYSSEHYDDDWMKLTVQIRDLEDQETRRAALLAERRQQLDALAGTFGPHLHKLPRWLAEWDPHEINRILHLLLQQVIVHPDGRVELVYKGE